MLVDALNLLVDWGIVRGELKHDRFVLTRDGLELHALMCGGDCKRCRSTGELVNRERRERGGKLHRTACPDCDGSGVDIRSTVPSAARKHMRAPPSPIKDMPKLKAKPTPPGKKPPPRLPTSPRKTRA